MTASNSPDSVLTSEKIDELILSNNRVAESSDRYALAMVEYQERSTVARDRYRKTMIVVVAGVSLILIALMVSVFVLVLKVNASQSEGARARKQIVDCTTPTGTCYKDGQKRTGELLQLLEKSQLSIAACTPEAAQLPLAQRIPAIAACSLKLLSQK